MRRSLIRIWLSLPVLGIAFHWMLGTQLAAHDSASVALSRGLRLEAQGNWSAAASDYDRALQSLPDSERLQSERVYLKLALARAKARSGQIVDALTELKALNESIAPNGRSAPLQEDVRRELASTSYYTAWLMRREGASRNQWEPYAEAARQDFRYLAEKSKASENRDQLNLEQVLHFAYASDDEFRANGLPEPPLDSNTGVTKALSKSDEGDSPSPSRGSSPSQPRGQDPSRSGGLGNMSKRGS